MSHNPDARGLIAALSAPDTDARTHHRPADIIAEARRNSAFERMNAARAAAEAASPIIAVLRAVAVIVALGCSAGIVAVGLVLAAWDTTTTTAE